MNAYFEDHAEHEYMTYVAENIALEQVPFESAFGADYGRFACLADLFRQIGYDERVHKLESLARLGLPRFQ
jgi:ubiquinol oxidase